MTTSLQTIVSSSASLHTSLHWRAINKSFGVALDVVCKATGSLSAVVTLWMSRTIWSSSMKTLPLSSHLLLRHKIRVSPKRLTQICQVRRSLSTLSFVALISLPWFISLRKKCYLFDQSAGFLIPDGIICLAPSPV